MLVIFNKSFRLKRIHVHYLVIAALIWVCVFWICAASARPRTYCGYVFRIMLFVQLHCEERTRSESTYQGLRQRRRCGRKQIKLRLARFLYSKFVAGVSF